MDPAARPSPGSGEPGDASGAIAVKIAIVGGPGSGKSVFVAALADDVAVTSEVATHRRSPSGSISAPLRPATTTAGFDLGRTVLGSTFAIYAFAASGEERFALMREHALVGASGAVVMVDAARVAESFAVIDELEVRDVPFVVLVNSGLGAVPYRVEELRDALAVDDDAPIIVGEAADPVLAQECVLRLMECVVVRRLTAGIGS